MKLQFLKIRLSFILACATFSLLLMTMSSSILAQTVDDVLENGHVVRERDKILLKMEGDKLSYDVWHNSQVNPLNLKDSSIFLVVGEGINIYMRPLNPLNYSLSSTTAFTPDKIQEDAIAAFDIIVKPISKLTESLITNKANTDNAAKTDDGKVEPPCKEYADLQGALEEIQTSLRNDQKKDIVRLFNKLKSMPFIGESATIKSIEQAQKEIEPLDNYFKDVKGKIDLLKEKLAKNSCTNPDPYLVKYVFENLIQQSETILKSQVERLNNLKSSLALVKIAQENASMDNEGISWLVKLSSVEIKKGKISEFALTIYESGYELSSSDKNKDEIILKDKKEIIKRTIRIRKFQRFVPEVVAGTAYTFLTFPKFGTSTDDIGKQVVTDAGEESFKRLNFNAMINFNYYVPNSSLHPFFQIGTGLNTDYPAFFSGAGIRINVGSNMIKAFSISGGVVSTWVKTLNKLKVGDHVSGTSELEKDITHEFKWPPKPYISFQIKL